MNKKGIKSMAAKKPAPKKKFKIDLPKDYALLTPVAKERLREDVCRRVVHHLKDVLPPEFYEVFVTDYLMSIFTDSQDYFDQFLRGELYEMFLNELKRRAKEKFQEHYSEKVDQKLQEFFQQYDPAQAPAAQPPGPVSREPDVVIGGVPITLLNQESVENQEPTEQTCLCMGCGAVQKSPEPMPPGWYLWAGPSLGAQEGIPAYGNMGILCGSCGQKSLEESLGGVVPPENSPLGQGGKAEG